MNFTPIVFAVALAVTACPVFGAIDTSKLPPPSDKAGVTYDKDIKPLFDQSCIRCHGGERQKAGLRLDSLEGVLKGSEDGKVVSVGKSVESPLVHAISQLDPKKSMPPKPRGGPGGGNRPKPQGDGNGAAPAASAPAGNSGGPGGPGGGRGMGPAAKPLTAEQVGLVRAWIDQGAK